MRIVGSRNIACNGKTLPLTARQIRAAVAKWGVVALRKVLSEVGHKRDFASCLDLLACRIHRMVFAAGSYKSHRDVLVHSTVEQNRALRDGTDVWVHSSSKYSMS